MRRVITALGAAVFAAIVLSGSNAWAQGQGTLSGTVVDSLGARVAGASVTLLRDGARASDTKSGSDGSFSFASLTPARYQVTATATGFDARTTDPVYVGAGDRASVEVALEIGPLQ